MNDNEVRELLETLHGQLNEFKGYDHDYFPISWKDVDTLSIALRERLEHRCPHFQPKGEDSGGAYNMQVIIDVTNELLSPDEIPRLSGTRWFQLTIKALIQRIANLRILLHDAELRASSPSSLAGETELNELRDLFPDRWIRIDRSLRFEPEMNAAPTNYVRISIDKQVDDFEAETLTEAMNQVRDYAAALKSVEREGK